MAEDSGDGPEPTLAGFGTWDGRIERFLGRW